MGKMISSGQNNDKSRPVDIRHLLATVFESKNWHAKLELHRVFDFWNSIVGREIAAIAQPSLIRGHVLWVKVADSVWMQHLHLQKILLLDKINHQLCNEKISDIRFQLNSTLAAERIPETGKAKPVKIDRKKEREFDKLISSLDNDDLKSSLKSLWVKIQMKGGEE